ncbi:unnamed protein product [Bursaphelenchus okinawaensis]|uniref:Protein kinase domain-containing protein n=1 Tax=Bursaphelenchus okinawaensis TaxID=465554 RepID=A0A811L9W8_9BILA|nr:unnamed protein product [Bursaphelenchus okinawaensis]CAG9119123.1 unnamed protein product [Bursaphelenchus okinawaensis]
MSSVLSSFFSRDPKSNFPYELPNDFFARKDGICMGHSFRKADPNFKATVFWTNNNVSTLRIQTQKLKTIRHPNVLTFLDSLESDNAFYLVTEPCVPIATYFEENQLDESKKELIVSWGLYQMLNTLKFLHNEAKISQNNIETSIYVTESGDWKLSGFQNTETFSSPKADLNQLANVIWQVFNGFNQSPPGTKTLTKIPRRLQGLFKKLDSKGKTFSAEDLLAESKSSGGFMKNKFVDTLLFLEEFQLKDSAEKLAFFMSLKDNLGLFPDNIAKYKLLPKLIHTYEYGDAGSHILVPMFKLGRLLDENEYQTRIVPSLVKLFSSPDRSTRVRLLEKIDEFAPHLNQQVVNEKIYSNLITGFMDTNPTVRESTVKAIVVFAEKLNYNNLNVDLMKYLARLQGSDDQPSIRTNTTICLGKIGCYLDPSHRQRILINAFTRGLKDPFPPARMAGVLALSATQQFYSLAEVASKVMPALSPLFVDVDKQVRDQAFKAFKNFLEKLEKASENPDLIPEFEAQVKSGGKGSILSTDKWAGWALKALSGKFYKGAVPPPPAPNQPDAPGNQNSTPLQQNKPAQPTPPRSNSPAFVDASSKPPSSRGSTTSSPEQATKLPNLGHLSSVQAKPAKKPLVLKKVEKKDGFLEDGGGWGLDEDFNEFSVSEPKNEWGTGKPTTTSKLAAKPKPISKSVVKAQAKPTLSPVKPASIPAKPAANKFAVKEESLYDSDDDWDTQW